MDPPAPFHPTATRRVRNPVRVGVGVIVVNDDQKIYAGIRKGSHGHGLWALPGGHLELYESWEGCARREVQEEMGMEISDVCFAHVTNDIMREEEKHYVTIFMMGHSGAAEPSNPEPNKCDGWEAFTWDELCAKASSGELFGPLEKLVRDKPVVVLDCLKNAD